MAETIINTGNVLPEYERKRDWETITPGDTTTTSTPVVPPQAVEAQGKLEASAVDQEKAERAQAELGKQTSQVEEWKALATTQQQQRDLQEKEQLGQFWQAERDRARAKTQAAQAKYAAMSSPSLFGNTDTQGKVMRGIGLALGGIGDAIQKAAMVRIGKAPPTIDTVGDIIEGILNQQREHIARLSDDIVRARTGEEDARKGRAEMLEDVDHRGLAQLKRIESIAAARLAALKGPQYDITADKNIAAIRERVANKEADIAQHYIGRIEKKLEGPTTKSGGEVINRSPTAQTGKPGAEDIKATSEFDDGIRNIDRMIQQINDHPQAWDEYRDNTEAWKRAEVSGEAMGGKTVRPLLQAGGLANISPEQGLKTPQAKQVHQYQEKINTSIAKGMGGVITEGDVARTAAAQANLALSAKEKVAQLQEMKGDMLAKRAAYEANRGVRPAAEPSRPAGGAPPPAQSPAPSAAPGSSDSARQNGIKLAKMKPGTPAAKRLILKWRITPEELQ